MPEEFVLYGGTAVALHFGHRRSIDFFGNKPLDPMQPVPAIPFLTEAIVTQRQPNTLSCIVSRDGEVKLSFFDVPALARLLPPEIMPDNRLQVATLLDLAGTKASVVQMRAEARDYRHRPQSIADLGEDDFREALDRAPPGIIDPRSWAYWNSKLGRYPAPPMPRRNLG